MEELKEGWRKVKLGEIANLKYGKMPKKDKIKENGYPIFSGYRITGYYDEYMLEEEEIIVVARGVGGTGDVKISPPKSFITNLSIILLLKNDINKKFLYYLLKNKNLRILDSGSAQSQITINDLKEYEIFLPNLKLQDKIASVLATLDEKIELNRKINQNLEEICQNYFVEIFIKNSNKNCSIGQISDLGNIVSGATPSKKNQKYYTNFGIPWITPKDLSKISNKFISRGNLDITELGFKNSSVRLLPKGSVLFSSRAPIGYIAICSNDVTTNQGFKSIVPFKNIGTEFVYYFLKNNVQFLESRASGSTFKEISTTIMATTPAIIPKEDPLKVFKKICINIFEKQYIIEKETEKLIELRDYLLPKLMNGEIDVSNLKISKILNSDLSFYLIQFFHLIKIKLKQFFLAILNHEF